MNFGLSNLNLGVGGDAPMVPQATQPQGNFTTQVPAKQTHAVAVMVPGRPVFFEWDQVDATHLVGEMSNPGQVTDLSFFLLPEATLPPGTGAALHFSTPPYTNWTVLGGIYPGNPSTTVRTGFQTPNIANQPHVRLGVSIEPLDVIQNLEQSHSISTAVERGEWGKKLAQDLYNHISSYSRMTPQGEQIVCPPNVLDSWLEHVNRKYQRDPNFVLKSN